MAYVAPYIDAAGPHYPLFADVLEDLKVKMRSIFGDDIYLENDSDDAQELAIVSLAYMDALAAAELAYNNRSPVSAVGTGLDSIIKMNGMARETPSYSSCVVTLLGTEGTVILNGTITDLNGYDWDLPATVTIGVGGTVSATAVCQTVGAITALPGDLSSIATPTLGWTSVTNAASAVPGTAVEEDSDLRARQTLSVASPSQTPLEKTRAALIATVGVSRSLALENYTGSPATDPNGLSLPSHSLTCVVEGGTDAAVAQSIYDNRGIGCNTNGDVQVTVADPLTLAETDIKFYRPTSIPIFVTLNIKTKTGYTSATADSIEQTVVDFLNALEIYQDVSFEAVGAAAQSVNPNLARPLFLIESVLIGVVTGTRLAADIVIDYTEVAEGLLANITINEV
jgi:uncharacterized phage protein gp47/JayE